MSAFDPIVMAVGDSGRLEPMRESETVTIKAVPRAAGNMVIPATVRWFSSIRGGGCIPTRLRYVRKPKAGVRDCVQVEFDCTPFLRYTLDSGPVFGDWSSCMVRDLTDARDPIFDGLTPREKARIVRAVTEGEGA